MLRSNFYTTESAGWKPYFNQNEGFKGLPLHDVLEKAELDFRAVKVPTFYRLPGSDKEILSNKFSVIREDNGQELGGGFSGDLDNDGRIMEKGYKVIQHEEALASIFHDTMDLEKDAYCVNAIGFDNGAQVAISFRMPEEKQIKPGDKLGLYLNFFNAFNGKDGLGWSWFFLRPVCQNTFNRARQKGENGYFTKHTQNVGDRLMLKADEILGIAKIQSDAISQQFIEWANQPVSDNLVKEFLNQMHPDKVKIANSVNGRNEAIKVNQGPANRREELYNVISSGELVDSNNLNAWNLFNGATKIASWKRQGRETDAEQFDYAQNGTGSGYANDAFNIIKKLFS